MSLASDQSKLMTPRFHINHIRAANAWFITLTILEVHLHDFGQLSQEPSRVRV